MDTLDFFGLHLRRQIYPIAEQYTPDADPIEKERLLALGKLFGMNGTPSKLPRCWLAKQAP